MKRTLIYLVIVWLLFSSFDFPNEKRFLAQQAADIEVFDANGNAYSLYSLLRSKPLIISPVYTKCPSLCGVISNGIQTVINELGALGKDFTMISFSFDSTDTVEDLFIYEKRWKMDGSNWKAVSATAPNIDRLMQSLDYQFDYNTTTKEFNHPSILIVLTPSGRISRYVYGVNPKKKDIRLAVIEAMAEKTRPGIIKGFYLRCFGYDPLTKTYKMDWRFIIATSAGAIMIAMMTAIFIKSFVLNKPNE